MAREHDRDGVAVHDRSDRTRGLRLARLCRQGAVGRDLTEGHASELLEHRAAEVAREAQVDIEVEPLALAGEVLVELPASGIDWPRRAKHPRAEAPCEPLALQARHGRIGDDARRAIRVGAEKL